MALLIHMPLNNKQQNLGTLNITPVNHNVIFTNHYSYYNGSNAFINIQLPNDIGNTWSHGIWYRYERENETAWLCPEILNTNGSDSDIKLGFWLKQNENRFESQVNGKYNSNINFTNEKKRNEWHHLFATYNGSSLLTYVDGQLRNTYNSTQALLSRTNFTIGGRATNANGSTAGQLWRGCLYDFRLYDEVLTAAQILQIYNETNPNLWEQNLKLWIPGTIDLHNQGISSTKDLLSTNHNILNGGKIGPNGLDYNAKSSGLIDLSKELKGSKELTIAMWLKVGTETASATSFLDPFNCTIINQDGNEELLKWELFSTNNASLGCWVGSLGKTYQLGTNITAGIWNHYCVVINFTTASFKTYTNGIKATTITTPFNTTNSPLYSIKGTSIRINEAVANFHNTYNDIRIYNKELTDTEVKRLASARIAHYTLTDTCWNASGTMCADSSGYNYKGSAATSVRTEVTPKYAKANIHNTSSPRRGIQFPFNEMLGLTAAGKKDYSISMWFYRPTDSSGWNSLIGGPSGYELEARQKSSGVDNGHTWNEIFTYSWSGQSGIRYIPFDTTKYNHMVITQDDSKCQIYLNGELKSTLNPTNIPIGNFWFGCWRDANSQIFTGNLSDIRVWSRAITADEVLEIYNNHKTVNYT